MPRQYGIASVLCLLVFASAAGAQTRADVQRARALVAEAGAAYRSSDLEHALGLIERAIALRPAHSVLLYSAAHIAGLTGRSEQALRHLAAAAALGLRADVQTDTAFSALADDPRFIRIVEQFADNAKTVGASTVAFRLEAADFLPEGIAYDDATASFFIGSVHRRRIVRVDGAGTSRDFITAAGRDPDAGTLYGVLGMAVDAARRRLWVTTAAVPHVRDIVDTEIGRTAVHVYDADSGKLLRAFEAPDSAHHFDDLAIDTVSGDVYISDSVGGSIYRIGVSDVTMSLLTHAGALDSPQGIAVFPAQHALVVADYSSGLWRIDVRTGEVVQLRSGRPQHLIGLDGIAVHGADVIAVQNYPEPHRVLRIALSSGLDRIDGVTVLESMHPAHGEPTHGVVVGNQLFYIANSQWARFEPGREAERASAVPPIILRLQLR